MLHRDNREGIWEMINVVFFLLLSLEIVAHFGTSLALEKSLDFKIFIIAFGAHLEQLSILELVGALLLLRIAFTWFCCCLSGDSLSIAVNFNNLLENNE